LARSPVGVPVHPARKAWYTLENIYERLGVSSRTAAVLRAFPDRLV
jgi:hypothetical protein